MRFMMTWCLMLFTLSSALPSFWPQPAKFSLNVSSPAQLISPCSIKYKIVAPDSTYIQQMLDFYSIQAFSCSQEPQSKITLTITVKNTSWMLATDSTHEQFTLTLSLASENSWSLKANYYAGFIRGLQTYSQIFNIDDASGKWMVKGLPININDHPEFQWRGLMVDSSRHFLSLDVLKKTVDALMYNKMNVLHWHITDEDSFPLIIPSRPQLCQNGKLSGSYSLNDVKSLIKYAMIRGVRIIPEIDSPGHTQSWGRKSLEEIVVKCNQHYQGQFDPTSNLTYDVVTDVLTTIDDNFIDSYVHLGGDQVNLSCWDNKPSIKEWMKNQSIANYTDLQIYYRKREKSIWKGINTKKKVIYWANEEINLPVEEDDVIQWWGDSKNVDKLSGKKNPIILSYYDLTYLDLGLGGRTGDSYGRYKTWRMMYAFEPKVKNTNIIGGQTCMWSQLDNENTHESKIWIRTSVLAERLWNSAIDIQKSILDISIRLIAQAARMKKRGFKVSSVSSQLCQKDPSICF